mgnify:CR=1 FL=1
MTPRQRELQQVLGELLGGTSPVVFVDAVEVTRWLRRLADLGEPLLQSTLALHDAPHTTDGAREVLGEFLQSYAARVGAEQERATRPLTLADSGKIVRAKRGSQLHLDLPARVGTGYQWAVARKQGPINMKPEPAKPGARARVRWQIALSRRGYARVALVETPPPKQPAQSGRKFEARIIVE